MIQTDGRKIRLQQFGPILGLLPMSCAGNPSVWLALTVDLNISYKGQETFFAQVTGHHPISVFQKGLLLLHFFCSIVVREKDGYHRWQCLQPPPQFGPLPPWGLLERKRMHFQIATILVEVYVGPYLTSHCNTLRSQISLCQNDRESITISYQNISWGHNFLRYSWGQTFYNKTPHCFCDWGRNAVATSMVTSESQLIQLERIGAIRFLGQTTVNVPHQILGIRILLRKAQRCGQAYDSKNEQSEVP